MLPAPSSAKYIGNQKQTNKQTKCMVRASIEAEIETYKLLNNTEFIDSNM
jgi:hypothetical protein